MVHVNDRVAAFRRRENIGLGLIKSIEYDESNVLAALIKAGELSEDSALDDVAVSAAISRVLHAWTKRVLAGE